MMNFGAISYTSIRIYSLFKSWLKKFGFALSEFICNHVKCVFDNGNYGCGIFIDLKKAFDTVNHTILLKKLYHYGIRGIPLQWFQSYLTSRKQFVSVNGHTSMELEIKHSVPQGSVLGPLLLLLYINDLSSISKSLTFYYLQMTQISTLSHQICFTYKNSKQRATESKKVARK